MMTCPSSPRAQGTLPQIVCKVNVLEAFIHLLTIILSPSLLPYSLLPPPSQTCGGFRVYRLLDTNV